MKINFGMWKTASWTLVKMDKKEEWDQLDVVSKWLIATRSAVTTVTIYACIIAGLLAWRDGYFSWLPWLIVTLGLFIAHGTNNFLNDYTDYSRGVDQGNYLGLFHFRGTRSSMNLDCCRSFCQESLTED